MNLQAVSAVAVAVLAEGDGGNSHDVLIGTIFTGLVTLILGYLATRGSRAKKEDKAEAQPEPAAEPGTLRWFQREVTRLNRKSEADDLEIDRLKDLCRDAGVDWRLSHHDE